jgi:hypothetical protein
MVPEAIGKLESALTPPTDVSVFIIDLDPAFEGIRKKPEFIAMMERHR